VDIDKTDESQQGFEELLGIGIDTFVLEWVDVNYIFQVQILFTIIVYKKLRNQG